jgi:hypothetical protein
MIEKKIESYLLQQVKLNKGQCPKWNSANNRGVTDRIVFLNGQVWFVELKSSTGKRAALQEYWEKLITEHTKNYIVISSIAQVNDFIRRVLNE